MSQQSNPSRPVNRLALRVLVPALLLVAVFGVAITYFPKNATGRSPLTSAVDPGPRGGAPGAGGFLTGLSSNEKQILPTITTEFNRAHDVVVTSPVDGGLGPRFNSNSCVSCHQYPAAGGSSPVSNPLFSVYQQRGASNIMPSFITTSGPILEARFIHQSDGVTPDGNIHQLFTISGRSDATGCSISQPDFTTAQLTGNLALRQPTPMYGSGLMEIIKNIDIVNNMNANLALKQSLGIAGHPNYSGNDGSIQRFGWKAQFRAVLTVASAQLNTEMGVTNEMFPTELDQTPGCVINPLPETVTNFTPGILTENFPGDAERDMLYATWLLGPKGVAPTPSTTNGQTQFNNIGCVLCHTTSFTTPAGSRPALTNQTITLYSDFLVHHMGPGLADGIAQGGAGPDEFRTAPLWGIGQRLFFMHDGRTKDLVQAIEDHYSLGNGTYGNSEANSVITNFNALSTSNQQDLLNFLRSL